MGHNFSSTVNGQLKIELFKRSPVSRHKAFTKFVIRWLCCIDWLYRIKSSKRYLKQSVSTFFVHSKLVRDLNARRRTNVEGRCLSRLFSIVIFQLVWLVSFFCLLKILPFYRVLWFECTILVAVALKLFIFDPMRLLVRDLNLQNCFSFSWIKIRKEQVVLIVKKPEVSEFYFIM